MSWIISYKWCYVVVLLIVFKSLMNLCVLLQAWGVDLSIERNPNKATLKYTQFLLETAAGKESRENFLERRKLAALTIAAMTPCMRLYAFLGQEIVKHTDEKFSDTPYHDWVDTYSSKTFQVVQNNGRWIRLALLYGSAFWFQLFWEPSVPIR